MLRIIKLNEIICGSLLKYAYMHRNSVFEIITNGKKI